MSKIETLVAEAQALGDGEKIQLLGELLGKGSTLWLSKSLSAMKTKFGVKAAAPPAAGPAAAPAEGPTAFDVILKDAGANKINVIKAVRTATSLGLKEAKDLVDKGGQPVKAGLPKEEADKLAKELQDAGATVEVKGH